MASGSIMSAFSQATKTNELTKGSQMSKGSLDKIDENATPDFGSAAHLYEYMQKTNTVMMYGHFYEMDQASMDALGFEKVYDTLDEGLTENMKDGKKLNGPDFVQELSEHDCMIGPDGAIYRVPEQFRDGFRHGDAFEYDSSDGSSRSNQEGVNIKIAKPKEELASWEQIENHDARKYYDEHGMKDKAVPFPDVKGYDSRMTSSRTNAPKERDVHNSHQSQTGAGMTRHTETRQTKTVDAYGQERLNRYGDPSADLQQTSVQSTASFSR